jgi:hypothetical protein
MTHTTTTTHIHTYIHSHTHTRTHASCSYSLADGRIPPLWQTLVAWLDTVAAARFGGAPGSALALADVGWEMLLWAVSGMRQGTPDNWALVELLLRRNSSVVSAASLSLEVRLLQHTNTHTYTYIHTHKHKHTHIHKEVTRTGTLTDNVHPPGSCR